MFDPRLDPVRCVPERMVLEQGFIRIIQFLCVCVCVCIIPSILHTHLQPHLLSPEGQTNETWEPSKNRCSFGSREGLGREVVSHFWVFYGGEETVTMRAYEARHWRIRRSHVRECVYISFFLQWRNSPSWPRPPHCRGFTITLRHTTLGRTPLDERSARRRDLYLTTHNTHNRQTSMPPAGFEPKISASERPQTDALVRAATGTGVVQYFTIIKTNVCSFISWLCIIWLCTLKLVTHKIISKIWNMPLQVYGRNSQPFVWHAVVGRESMPTYFKSRNFFLLFL